MRASVVLLVFVVLLQSLDRSVLASLPNGVDTVQLSPRLLYRKLKGQLTARQNAVDLARNLLNKLNLEHKIYKLNQAKILENNELLFEMQSYLDAIEVVRAWRRQIFENELSPVAAEKSKNCYSDCVNSDFELIQTERGFFNDVQLEFRIA